MTDGQRPSSPSRAAREEHALLQSASVALASRASRQHVHDEAMDEGVDIFDLPPLLP